MPGIFVISTGRCGSTMLARMLRCNPRWLIVDEFFTTFRTSVDSARLLSRKDFVRKLVSPISPRFVTRRFLDVEAALGREAEELTYRRRPDARYTVYDCPCVLAVTLPSISDQPEIELAQLAGYGEQASPKRLFLDHSLRLFDHWREAKDKAVWVERSGWSTPYVGLVHRCDPSVRYIYLQRDARETVLSMAEHPYFALVGEIRTMLARHGIAIDELASGSHLRRDLILLAYAKIVQPLFGRPWRFIDYYGPGGYAERLEIAARLYREATRRAESFIDGIPRTQVLRLTYDELIGDPHAAAARVAAFVADAPQRDDWIDAAAAIPERRPSKYATLEPALAARLDAWLYEPGSRSTGNESG